jgi:hypothetical protein
MRFAAVKPADDLLLQPVSFDRVLRCRRSLSQYQPELSAAKSTLHPIL